MGLDVYVMPIWRFKAGDFVSPLEPLGAPVSIVSPGGITTRLRPKGPKALWAEFKAKREVAALRRELSAQLGHPITWNESGPCVYESRGLNFTALRAYARWLDLRDHFPTFHTPADYNYSPHPVFYHKVDFLPTYPQIHHHSFFSGYFLPTDTLTGVLQAEAHPSWIGNETWYNTVGSSYALRREITDLAKDLGITADYTYTDADPLSTVKCAAAQLLALSQLSCQHALPIIFWG